MFKDTVLTFEDDKIMAGPPFYNEVMMSWEDPIMKRSAEFICESKGDILEIGFGMGICADYIQAQNVKSHTIIEMHPQVIERLKTWASDKDNVILIESDWYKVKNISGYDGIFFDTFGDKHWPEFKQFALKVANKGAKITYWNNSEDENTAYGFKPKSFEEINIVPDSNKYTDIKSTYYMPKVIV